MTADRASRLELEVRFEAEPIEGRLYDPDENRPSVRPFSGWLGLMAALEAARVADRCRRRRTEAEHESNS